MNKRTIMVLCVSFFLVVTVFTGVFVAVLNGREAELEKPAKIIYERLEALHRNKSYVDAESVLKELNSKFPESKYTKQANQNFKSLTALAEKERIEKPAKAAEYAAQQAENIKRIQEAEKKNSVSAKQSSLMDIQDLPRYLDSVLPEEGKGQTIIARSSGYPDYYSVICQYEAKDKVFQENDMKRTARDFIFKAYSATYASNLPVISVTIVIHEPGGTLGLSTTLGRKLADRSERGVWNDKGFTHSIFFDWMEKHKNNTSDVAMKCTYLGRYSN